MEDIKLYTYPEAAEALDISERKLADLVRTRAIAHRRIGGSVRFTPSDIHDYLESVRVPSQGDRDAA